MPVQHRTTKANAWQAWSGELDDLRRIGSAFSVLADRRSQGLADEYDAANPSTPPVVQAHKKQRIREEWTPSATLRDGDDQISGPISDVIDELDRRSVSYFELSAGERIFPNLAGVSADGLQVKFDRAGSLGQRPVSLAVASNDQGWARQALTQLTEEIEKGVPRWAWCRSGLGRLLAFLVIGTTAGLLALAASKSISQNPDLHALITIPSAIFVGWFAASNWTTNFFFPRFEVTSQAESTGSRRIVALGLIVLSVPVGIFVNWIS